MLSLIISSVLKSRTQLTVLSEERHPLQFLLGHNRSSTGEYTSEEEDINEATNVSLVLYYVLSS